MGSKMSQIATPIPEPVAAETGGLLAHKGKLLIGLVVLIGALGYLAFMALESATVYYYTVGELADRGPTQEGEIVRVSGKLTPDSFFREDGSTVANFSLTDGVQSMNAVHDGVLPDLFFNEHSDIILEGSYTPRGVFESQNVIIKCPSKYIAEDGQG